MLARVLSVLRLHGGVILAFIIGLTAPAALADGPTLGIKHQTGALVLSWTNYPSFQLESTTNPSVGGWTAVSNNAVTVNGQFVLTNPVTGAIGFYRLTCGTNAPPYLPGNSTIGSPGPIVNLNSGYTSVTFDASAVLDPSSCYPDTLTYLWTVNPSISGLVNTTTPTLTMPTFLVQPNVTYQVSVAVTGYTGLTTTFYVDVTFVASGPPPPPSSPNHNLTLPQSH